jgi:hypothetical protein
MILTPSIRRLLCLAGLGLALALAPPGRGLAADPEAVSEYQVKAAFLYNFTKFVEWPNSSFAATNAAFVIGIVGNDPFGGTLDEVVKSGQAHGRLLQVKRLKSGDRIGDCQILFVSRSETGNIESFLQDLGQQPVLTVGDAEGDAARGLMINLIVVKGSVKMEINRQRAEQSHLQISSKLLGLAKIVESEK